jgi:hypothetical protein
MSVESERKLHVGGRPGPTQTAAGSTADGRFPDDAASAPASSGVVPLGDDVSLSPPGTNGGELPLRSALSILTRLGPPLTIATALMFYFGWARSDAQARFMGLDVSLFGFSTQDYVLQSISTLYIPLLVVAVLALGGLALHQHIYGALSRPSARPVLRTTGWVVLAIGTLAGASAVFTAAVNRNSGPLVIPLILAAGTALAAYGGWLAAAAAEVRTGNSAAPPWHRALRALLVGVVITLALFWEVSNYADVVGRGYALETARTIPALPRATAFSATPLGIQAPGVHEERLQLGPDIATNAFRYRTSGLRFLARSGGRIFLLHDGWTPRRGTVIVLPDNDQVRWQFSR